MMNVDPQKLMSGIWQFHPDVTEDEVVELAKGLADGPDGENYLDLHVRSGSNDSFVLGFKYHLEYAGEEAHEAHFHKMHQILKDQVGKENISAWSTSTPTTIIK